MTEAILVGRVSDFADDSAIVIPADANSSGVDLAVFRSDGRFFSLDDRCTHQRASLADGWIEACEVECPLHSARFSLVTGKVLCPPASIDARTHLVEVRGEEVWLFPGVPARDAARAD